MGTGGDESRAGDCVCASECGKLNLSGDNVELSGGSAVDRARTHEEHLVDELLVLALLEAMGRSGPWHEVMKVMKAAFHAGWGLCRRGMKGLSLAFYTWRHGPLSKDLYRVLDSLVEAGLAKKRIVLSRSLFSGRWRAPAYAISTKGSQVVQGCQELLAEGANAEIVRDVIAAAEHVGPMDPIEARDESHRMQVPDCSRAGDLVAIGELAKGTDLITLADLDEAPVCFSVTDDWFETLEMMLSPDYEPGAMRRASQKSYEELFAGM